MKPRRLRKPPITEALIDLRAELPASTTVEHLSAFHQAVSSTYPESQKHMTFAGSIGVGPDGQAHVSVPPAQHVGFLCRSADQLQVAQARLDGFTLNRLHPYTHWDQFSAEARALWSEYVQVAKPNAVVRLAVRYINRVEIPAGTDLKEYFKTLPVLSPELPQRMSNPLMRLVLPVGENRGAVLTMAAENVEQAKKSETIPIILDIDASHEQRFGPNDAKIWETLQELRDLKNQIFFGSLTDKALERYL